MKNYLDQINLYFELQGVSESFRESYLRRIKYFIEYLYSQLVVIENTSYEDIQRFVMHLKKDRNLSAGTINNYISAARFFWINALNKKWNYRKVPRMKTYRKLPEIPSKEDILKIINLTSTIKQKAIFSLLYGSGLRIGEVARLRIGDICSKSMSVKVEEAKHNTTRYSILSNYSLNILRQYFKMYFTKDYSLDDWLFKGAKPGSHITTKTIGNTLAKIRAKYNLRSNISPHTLRHCFATHLLENGVELPYIQQLLGHKHLSSTQRYLHMTSKSLLGVTSPLDIGDCNG